MIKVEMTKHASITRSARFEFIAETVGFGTREIASYTYTSQTSTKPSKNVLMDNGVVFVYSCETGKLVTAFIATIGQGAFIYKHCHGCDRCPRAIMNIFYNNQDLVDRQPK